MTTTIHYANGIALDCDDYEEAVRAIKIQEIAANTKRRGDKALWKGESALIYYYFEPVDETPFVDGGWKDLYFQTEFGSAFRVFANRKQHAILSYLDGDWRLVQCSGVAAYRREIRQLREIRAVPVRKWAA